MFEKTFGDSNLLHLSTHSLISSIKDTCEWFLFISRYIELSKNTAKKASNLKVNYNLSI